MDYSNWIQTNKEWLFSGIGISAIGLFYFAFVGIKTILNNRNIRKLNKDLRIKIDRAIIKYLHQGHYGIQINLVLTSPINTRSIRKIRLKAKEDHDLEIFGKIYSKEGHNIGHVFPYQESDLLRVNNENLESGFGTTNENAIAIRDYCLKDRKNFSITIIDIINSARYPDGWEDLAHENWQLVVDYDDNISKSVEFSFQIHTLSKSYSIREAYEGFEGRIVKNSSKDFI